MKHLIGINDLSIDEIDQIMDLAEQLKEAQSNQKEHAYLKGKTVGMIFSKSSTRTRVSFETGVVQLGGYPIYLNANDIQLGRGETVYDTAKVLSRYIDGIVIRTSDHQDVLDLAKYGTIPVVNALTDLLHPCQVLADLFTIKEEFGTLENIKIAYVGDGNNIAHSLLYGCSKIGVDLSIATPIDYQCDPSVIEKSEGFANTSASKLFFTHNPEQAVESADVVYTDTWISMGQESEKNEKTKAFEGFQVDQTLFDHANDSAIFLHCLPAYRGYEVTKEVIDGPRSRIYQQAENRLHVQKAILSILMGGK